MQIFWIWLLASDSHMSYVIFQSVWLLENYSNYWHVFFRWNFCSKVYQLLKDFFSLRSFRLILTCVNFCTIVKTTRSIIDLDKLLNELENLPFAIQSFLNANPWFCSFALNAQAFLKMSIHLFRLCFFLYISVNPWCYWPKFQTCIELLLKAESLEKG